MYWIYTDLSMPSKADMMEVPPNHRCKKQAELYLMCSDPAQSQTYYINLQLI